MTVWCAGLDETQTENKKEQNGNHRIKQNKINGKNSRPSNP